MKPDDYLKDPLISRIIHSDDPVPVPADLHSSIMMKIEELPARQPLRAVKPPLWLRWGIPGFLGMSIFLIVITGGDTGLLAFNLPETTWVKELFDKTNNWFTDLFKTAPMPEINIPDNVIWIICAGITLFWGFVLLNRFLEKHLTP